MARVNTLVITGYGTNCEVETAHAARQTGADQVDIVFFSDLVAGRTQVTDYNFLIFPGGFLDGDDLGAAQAAALRWRFATDSSGSPLLGQLERFLNAGGIILGICNGFQLLVKLGLLPALGGKYFERMVSLSNNDSARFEDRWVWLKANPKSPCIFTRSLDSIYLPVRHGEGKLVPRDASLLNELDEANCIALRYADPTDSDESEYTMRYPYNPNGSPLGIAGLTDPSGRILGLMPHPEAYNHPTNHPGWTRGEEATLGIEMLANGIRHLKSA